MGLELSRTSIVKYIRVVCNRGSNVNLLPTCMDFSTVIHDIGITFNGL